MVNSGNTFHIWICRRLTAREGAEGADVLPHLKVVFAIFFGQEGPCGHLTVVAKLAGRVQRVDKPIAVGETYHLYFTS